MNLFLGDVYGEQKIIKDGVVPTEFVHTAKAFLPAFIGVKPPKNIRTHISGIDLVKDTKTNDWIILEDNLRVPSGASYPLSIRKAYRKVYPEFFENLEISKVKFYPKYLEEAIGVTIHFRSEVVQVVSDSDEKNELTRLVLQALLVLVSRGQTVNTPDVVTALTMARNGEINKFIALYEEEITKDSNGKPIRVKTLGQKIYVEDILHHDITFGIGPAGTGKTYLAVVLATTALRRGQVKRIIVTRPAVEAGENLGFLPGDLQEKVDPYLRPIYDALYNVLGKVTVERMLERGTIEIAPLAYMRGRTLDDAFVILDEAQNTTPEQMKMFLTRLGFGSRAVITGDVTQVDLPRGQQSGLAQALRVLENVHEIHITRFHSRDVVRHQLVQKIVEAYEGWDSEQQRLSAEARAERKAKQEALIAENDSAADAQHI